MSKDVVLPVVDLLIQDVVVAEPLEGETVPFQLTVAADKFVVAYVRLKLLSPNVGAAEITIGSCKSSSMIWA